MGSICLGAEELAASEREFALRESAMSFAKLIAGLTAKLVANSSTANRWFLAREVSPARFRTAEHLYSATNRRWSSNSALRRMSDY